VHGRFIAVLDRITRWDERGRGAAHESPGLEANWQFAPGELKVDAEAFRVETAHPDSNLAMLFPLRPENAQLTVHTGEQDPVRGWVRSWPTKGFNCEPAPQLTLQCEPMTRFEEQIVTVLLPFSGPDAPGITASATPAGKTEPGTLTLGRPDGARDEILWTDGLDVMLGPRGELDTDGALAYIRRDGAGRIEAAASVDATYLETGGVAPSGAGFLRRLGTVGLEQ
jgi:hypothetical protein